VVRVLDAAAVVRVLDAAVITVFHDAASAATKVRLSRTLGAACDAPKTETFPAHYGLTGRAETQGFLPGGPGTLA
jgi:hypothetical protein